MIFCLQTRYEERIRDIESQPDEASPSGTRVADNATKNSAWVDSAGGKERGRVYACGALAGQVRSGATSFYTQESMCGPSTSSSSADT